MSHLLKQRIIERCLRLGACAARVAGPHPPKEDVTRYNEWIEKYSPEGMAYLKRQAPLKTDARNLWPLAKSVVCIAVAYDCGPRTEESRIHNLQKNDTLSGHVASYAQHGDYHLLLKKLLDTVGKDVVQWTAGKASYRVCVDTAPLLEKSLARSCGLGRIGKNTCLIVPKVGSRVVLGELLLDISIPKDPPLEGDPCRNCHLCVDACPQKALLGNGRLHPQRCLSYLSIEYSGDLDDSSAQKMENRLFGCDQCLSVCPYNKESLPSNIKTLKSSTNEFQKNTLDPLGPWLSLSQASRWGSNEIKRRLRGTSLNRLSPSIFRRNLCAVLGNIGGEKALSILKAMLESPSSRVRRAAQSAMDRSLD